MAFALLAVYGIIRGMQGGETELEMGVLLLTFIISGLGMGALAVAILKVLGRYGKESQGVRFAVAVFCIVLLLPTVLLVLPVVWKSTVKEGAHITRAEYHGVMGRLPDAAEDITYYSDHAGTEAVFQIDCDHFVAWCKDEGWQAKRTEDSSVSLHHLGIANEHVDGYTVSALLHPRGTGYEISYDLDSRKVYFTFNSY